MIFVGYSASESVSPVRMRNACSIGDGENLAVADLAGLGRVADRLGDLVGLFLGDGDLDADLRQEVHRVFGAAIDFGVALLPAVAFDLGDGHALDADAEQGVADLLELERLDDGNDQLHGCAHPCSAALQPLISAHDIGNSPED